MLIHNLLNNISLIFTYQNMKQIHANS